MGVDVSVNTVSNRYVDGCVLIMNRDPSHSLPCHTAVTADVQVSSVAAVAGLALRVSSGQEPAAFYVLKLGATSTTYAVRPTSSLVRVTPES